MNNYIIKNSKWEPGDDLMIFGEFEFLNGKPTGKTILREKVEFIDAKDYEDLCVKLGAYESRAKAKQAGRTGSIPTGYSDSLKLSKTRVIYLWNPDKKIADYA